jgi:predicted dehydrogenase
MAHTSLRLAFIGAGQVNFGGGEGPWDHASRIERLVRENPHITITVVAIAEPFIERARKVLAARQEKAAGSSGPAHPRIETMWKDTQIYSDVVEMLEKSQPHAVFIGTPPETHGVIAPPNNIEKECCDRGISMFIEKPISCHPLGKVEDLCKYLEQAAPQKGVVVSVGYMFRYSQAVLHIKSLIEKYGPLRAFNARYNCAYSTISKDMWWDTMKSGGPIIEQATHFCDLARFLGGDIDMDSLQATSIKQTDPVVGKLNSIPKNIHEDEIPPERRIPRVTSAFWKFKSGAIGSLMHGALLHEIKYESELEVWGDGYRIELLEPYSKCRLRIRLPHHEESKIIEFYEDDYYYNEDVVFLEAVLNGLILKEDPDNTELQEQQSQLLRRIQSPYADAIETYRFTWKIRTKSEQTD